MCRENGEIQSAESDGRDAEHPAAILFLDVKGYSKLDRNELKVFHSAVMKELYGIFQKYLGDKKYYTNTWGDAIFIAASDYRQIIKTALEFRDYFGKQEYRRIKVGTLYPFDKVGGLEVRIALNYDDDFIIAKDPFQGDREVPYGPAIIETARLEPVTKPGAVYATAEFERKKNKYGVEGIYTFHPAGEKDLPKGFGKIHVFEVTFVRQPPRGGAAGGGGGSGDTPPTGGSGGAGAGGGGAGGVLPGGGGLIPPGRAERMQDLLGKDPNDGRDPMHICHQHGDRPCEGQVEAVCLVSEFRRANVAMSESGEIAHRLADIHKKISNIERKPDYFGLLSSIRAEIKDFVKHIEGLDRRYPEGSFLGFRERIVHMLKNRTRKTSDRHSVFADRIWDISQMESHLFTVDAAGIKKLTDEGQEMWAKMEEIDATIMDIIGELEGSVPEQIRRLGDSIETAVTAVSPFSRKSLKTYLQKTLKGLPHNVPERVVPKIWAMDLT